MDIKKCASSHHAADPLHQTSAKIAEPISASNAIGPSRLETQLQAEILLNVEIARRIGNDPRFDSYSLDHIYIHVIKHFFSYPPLIFSPTTFNFFIRFYKEKGDYISRKLKNFQLFHSERRAFINFHPKYKH